MAPSTNPYKDEGGEIVTNEVDRMYCNLTHATVQTGTSRIMWTPVVQNKLYQFCLTNAITAKALPQTAGQSSTLLQAVGFDTPDTYVSAELMRKVLTWISTHMVPEKLGVGAFEHVAESDVKASSVRVRVRRALPAALDRIKIVNELSRSKKAGKLGIDWTRLAQEHRMNPIEFAQWGGWLVRDYRSKENVVSALVALKKSEFDQSPSPVNQGPSAVAGGQDAVAVIAAERDNLRVQLREAAAAHNVELQAVRQQMQASKNQHVDLRQAEERSRERDELRRQLSAQAVELEELRRHQHQPSVASDREQRLAMEREQLRQKVVAQEKELQDNPRATEREIQVTLERDELRRLLTSATKDLGDARAATEQKEKAHRKWESRFDTEREDLRQQVWAQQQRLDELMLQAQDGHTATIALHKKTDQLDEKARECDELRRRLAALQRQNTNSSVHLPSYQSRATAADTAILASNVRPQVHFSPKPYYPDIQHSYLATEPGAPSYWSTHDRGVDLNPYGSPCPAYGPSTPPATPYHRRTFSQTQSPPLMGRSPVRGDYGAYDREAAQKILDDEGISLSTDGQY